MKSVRLERGRSRSENYVTPPSCVLEVYSYTLDKVVVLRMTEVFYRQIRCSECHRSQAVRHRRDAGFPYVYI